MKIKKSLFSWEAEFSISEIYDLRALNKYEYVGFIRWLRHGIGLDLTPFDVPDKEPETK
jgi:hypothetical protein